jgi:PAS domain S-box-containing protein
MKEQLSHTAVQRLRAAVESAPSGLVMVDASGMMVLVNREVERLFGYAREELLGKPVELLIPERLQAEHPDHRASFLRDPRVRAMGAGRDLHGRRKDGTEVPVEIGLTPVVTEEGLFVLAAVVDISARRRAEERFRTAVESSPAGTIMTDSSGRIVLVNREVERLFGYTREELLGAPIETLVPERYRAPHPSYRAAFFANPKQRPMGAGRELYGLRKDGTEVPVEIALTPIEMDEGGLVLASIVDISARKRTEAERRQLEEQLQQAQRVGVVGTLAGGIAHDFNNILGGIVGYAELLRTEIRDGASRSDIEGLLAAATRGRQIVKRILQFSRQQEQERKPLALDVVVRDAASMLRQVLPTSIGLRSTLQERAPLVVGDQTAIHQILLNLATNAAHAMPEGGAIEIGVEAVYVRDSVARSLPDLHEGPYVLMTVRDTGTGMDAVTQARVFEPFFTTKPPGSGSGLGLAIVRRLMLDHGGAVGIDSSPGDGTVVRCYFPAHNIEAEITVAGPEPLPRGHGERVLVVDDEKILVDVCQRRLQAAGYRVHGTTNPQEAVALIERDPNAFDVVVTDFTMPQMTGEDLARRITAVRAGMPIILVTGSVADFPMHRVAKAGVDLVLQKPLTIAELASAIRDVLDQHHDASTESRSRD